MKHVGKMKNNAARIVAVYRTLPNDPDHCLVVGTQGLSDSYHDALMSLIESDAGQQSNELADILAVRKFPDGSNMLQYLHSNGHLKKVTTSMVLMTPNPQTQLVLSELNELIAKQKGISVKDLAVTDGQPTTNENLIAEKNVSNDIENSSKEFKLSPNEMRSRADSLFKEASRLRKEADLLDPPKKKSKIEKSDLEIV